ncbi:MAG: hypothetical protein P8P36_05315 [Akkermansiaceae bacterium]|nr:hypothetical protein [Akkermansiaceae bacterium]
MKNETGISDRQVRRLSLIMFLAGIPVAWLVYSGFLDKSDDSLVWRMKYVGGIIWFTWIIRALWKNPPRSFSVILWSISLIWHLQFMPLVFIAGFHLVLFYLVVHAMVMAGYSGLLLVRDRPQKPTKGEQDSAPNPLPAE